MWQAPSRRQHQVHPARPPAGELLPRREGLEQALPASSVSGSSGASSTGTTAATAPGNTSSGSSGSSSLASSSTATISISQPPNSNLNIVSNVGSMPGGSQHNGQHSAMRIFKLYPFEFDICGGEHRCSGGDDGRSARHGVNERHGRDHRTDPARSVGIFDANPGDDAQVQERLRLLAQLDLPRPELIITAWVAQNSSTKQEYVASFANRVSALVASYNRQFDFVVQRGWAAIKAMSVEPGFYNLPFQRYVSNVFITDGYKPGDAGSDPQTLAQTYLDYSQAQIVPPLRSLVPVQESDLSCQPVLSGIYFAFLEYSTNIDRSSVNTGCRTKSRKCDRAVHCCCRRPPRRDDIAFAVPQQWCTSSGTR